MSSINTITISGNIGRDPEQKSTQGGSFVLRFSVAVTDSRRGQDGQYTDYVSWVSCVMFGKRAESIAQYLHKGSKVCVQGKIRETKWQTRDGQNRSTLEVIVDEISFDSQQQRQPQYQQPQPYQQPQMQPQMQQQPTPSLYDSSVPF